MAKNKKLEALYQMQNSANITCKEFSSVLKALGFQVVDKGSAGHKIAKHPAINIIDFPDYNCGHDAGTKIKRPYIIKLIKFVQNNEEIIKEYIK